MSRGYAAKGIRERIHTVRLDEAYRLIRRRHQDRPLGTIPRHRADSAILWDATACSTPRRACSAQCGRSSHAIASHGGDDGYSRSGKPVRLVTDQPPVSGKLDDAAMTLPIIPSRPFDHPAAWTAAQLGCRDTFGFGLDDRHIAASEAAAAGLREHGLTAFEDISHHDFPLDAIAEDVRAWRHEVADGRGLLLLRGFPVDRWSQEDTELVWCGVVWCGVVRPRHPLRPGGVAERARRPAGARGHLFAA